MGEKKYYIIDGYRVISDYELKEAYSTDILDEYDVKIEKNSIPEDIRVELAALPKIEGRFVYQYKKDRSVVHFFYEGTFMMLNGNTIIYSLENEYKDVIVSQIFLCMCLGIISIQRSDVMLHGSGVFYKGKAIVISGESGAGKSTFTDAFLKDAEFMADDTVRTEIVDGQLIAYPGYPQRKLCSDTIERLKLSEEELIFMPDLLKNKFAIRNHDEYHETPEQLGALVVIHKSDVNDVELHEIDGADKIKVILECLYKQEAYAQMGISTETFKKCLSIAKQIPVYELLRPMQGMTVEQQVRAVKNIL